MNRPSSSSSPSGNPSYVDAPSSWVGARDEASVRLVLALVGDEPGDDPSLFDPRFSLRAPCCPWNDGPLSAFLAWESALHRAFPGARQSLHVRSHGGSLGMCRIMRGVHAGPFLDVAPTGRDVAFALRYRLSLHEGRLRHVELFSDLRLIVRQLAGRGELIAPGCWGRPSPGNWGAPTPGR